MTGANAKIKKIYVGNSQVRPKSSRLPSTYQEVTYIQSTGTQYINTGLGVNQNTIIEMKFNAQSNSVTYPRPYWTSNALSEASQKDFGMQFYTGGPTASIVNNSNAAAYRQQINFLSFAWNTDYTTRHTNTSLTVNGVVQGTCSATTYSISYPLFIFELNRGGSAYDRKPSMKLYWFKMYSGTTLQRDFVPCYRKSDSVIGLYDLVNNQFYTNQGSGTFTKGGNVN